MNRITVLAIAIFSAIAIAAGVPKAEAQLNIQIGVAPSCPYGYYDYTPYRCAPYGYYGSEWFHGHTFIGVGPWFRGGDDFHGHVDNRFDPNHGYNGRFPNNGERPHSRNRFPKHFSGNETRDGREHRNEDHHDH